MNNIRNIAILLLLVFTGFYACKESDRITIGSDDTTPPDAPILVDTMLLNGGVRIYYKIPTGPKNEDLLSIDAEYTASTGELRRFSASFYLDSLDVLGLTDEQTILLYATDRAGNKSTVVPITVKPLESAISQVYASLTVKAGFDALVVNWQNPLQEPMSVYVKTKYTKQGVNQEATTVFSSNNLNERQFINDLKDIQTVDVTVYVEDRYGNKTKSLSEYQIELYQDVEIPKEHWVLPNANDTIGGIPMMFGNGLEGRTAKVIDGIIDFGFSQNYLQTSNIGRTGVTGQGNVPWNLIIDLGEKYELSRIITYQQHFAAEGTDPERTIGTYFAGTNVGYYRMYVWVLAGDPRQKPWNPAGWELIGERKIPIPPTTLPVYERIKIAHAGDEVLMYPDNPRYTTASQYFRYEAVANFAGPYTGLTAQVLSEITLYGKKSE
jgi:hypothetical protein